MKSVLIYSEAFIRMNSNNKDGVNFDCARVHQPVDTLKYEARAGKREISPLARRAALRALNRALALPEGANLLYI